MSIPDHVEVAIVCNTIGQHAPALRNDLVDALNIVIADMPTGLHDALGRRLLHDSAAMARLYSLREGLERV
jgi:hypothetical protein